MKPDSATIAQRRGELRTSDESKTQVFHLAAFLMERNNVRNLGFNAFQVALDSEILTRLGKRLASYALRDCNVGLGEHQERQREKTADEAREVAKWYDLTAHCYGDPRGYVLKLKGEDVRSNNMGDGFGVA